MAESTLLRRRPCLPCDAVDHHGHVRDKAHLFGPGFVTPRKRALVPLSCVIVMLRLASSASGMPMCRRPTSPALQRKTDGLRAGAARMNGLATVLISLDAQRRPS